MNNCIGLNNQKAFLLFNFYTMLSSLFTVIAASVEAYECFGDQENCKTFTNLTINMIAIIIALISGLFMLFTVTMFVDQVQMIREETSTIDKLQSAKQNLVVPEGGSKIGLIQGLGGWSWFFWVPYPVGVDLTPEGQLD